MSTDAPAYIFNAAKLGGRDAPAGISNPVPYCANYANPPEPGGYGSETLAKHTRKPAQTRRLFLKEHREDKNVSTRKMAERLGIDRGDLWRLEKGYDPLDSWQQLKFAEAVGVEPGDLWRPPGVPSVDVMLADAPDDVRALVVDMVVALGGAAAR